MSSEGYGTGSSFLAEEGKGTTFLFREPNSGSSSNQLRSSDSSLISTSGINLRSFSLLLASEEVVEALGLSKQERSSTSGSGAFGVDGSERLWDEASVELVGVDFWAGRMLKRERRARRSASVGIVAFVIFALGFSLAACSLALASSWATFC